VSPVALRTATPTESMEGPLRAIADVGDMVIGPWEAGGAFVAPLGPAEEALLRGLNLAGHALSVGVSLVQHKTRGFSCRKTSKEGHAENLGVVLYVLAAQLSVCLGVCVCSCVIRQISANFL
jgi:hypothetical protein